MRFYETEITLVLEKGMNMDQGWVVVVVEVAAAVVLM